MQGLPARSGQQTDPLGLELRVPAHQLDGLDDRLVVALPVVDGGVVEDEAPAPVPPLPRALHRVAVHGLAREVGAADDLGLR
jgi:hypothetical protein